MEIDLLYLVLCRGSWAARKRRKATSFGKELKWERRGKARANGVEWKELQRRGWKGKGGFERNEI